MSSQFQCARCGTTIELHDDHTEIIRRDFVGEPQPSRIEYLCATCWEEYEAFLAGPRASGERIEKDLPE